MCVVCSIRGTLIAGPTVTFRPLWDKDSKVYCCLTMVGKGKHVADLATLTPIEKGKLATIAERYQE